MVNIDEFEGLLNEVAEELPQVFYQELNGGILLQENAKVHPKARQDDLYILGEYTRSYTLGRFITIYYGSFMKMYEHLEAEPLKEEIRRVLRHEFRHHMEGQAGLRDLEVEDKVQLAQYEGRFKR